MLVSKIWENRCRYMGTAQFRGEIHWIFNGDVWCVRCYSSISIDWLVPHDGVVVVLILHHSLWLELVSFVCNLDIMIFADVPVEMQVAIHCGFIVPGDVLWFGYYLTSRYNMIHCLFMFWAKVCICSPLAGHILLSGSFWSLLPGLELLPIAPLFLL